MNNNIIILSRDTEALLIPSGARIYLHKGTEVTITQALGDTYTVNIYGNLARIEGKDADALGKEPTLPPTKTLPEGMTLSDMVWNELKTCYDPEIPVNIVDLGLIYHCDLIKQSDSNYKVEITMTLTAPGCGMGPVLTADIKQKILSLPTITEANIELVFDPPWDRSMISDAAKLQLGML